MTLKYIHVMIAGAEKSGTSSLLRYLGGHPKICTHKQGEMTFFVRDEEYSQGYESIFKRYYGSCEDAQSLIVAKSVDVMYIPEAARRLREYNPSTHIILVFRNPVDRAYSAYWHSCRRGWEDIAIFEDAIAAEPRRLLENGNKWLHSAYLDRGLYDRQMEVLCHYFSPEHIHPFLYEDLQEDPVSLCQQIFKITGIATDFIPETDIRHNKSSMARSAILARFLVARSPLKRCLRNMIPDGVAGAMRRQLQQFNQKEFTPSPMSPTTRQSLTEYFRPHNENLARMIRRDLSHWNI